MRLKTNVIHLGKPMNKILIFVLFISILFSQIDNPDSPNYLKNFEEKSKPYIAKIESANTTSEMLKTSIDYSKFLDNQLNTYYNQLRKKLTKDQKNSLKKSQLAWIKYRDNEFEFLETTFTRESFGSFAVIGIQNKKANIIKNRITELITILSAFGV